MVTILTKQVEKTPFLKYNESNYYNQRGGLSVKKCIAFFLALLLCVSILLTSVPCVSAATGDEIRTAKKIISVVYDDSGSMEGDRWVYASYAMQALVALLNEQDELYITYMSDKSNARTVSLSDLNKAVEGIRTWSTKAGETPGKAVKTARDHLDTVSCSDPSAQYWLIIMTDGSITGISLQETLNSYKNNQMPNGSRLNTAYMAMGTGARTAVEDRKNGLYTFAPDDNSITAVMAEMANLISSRMNADKVKQVDDKTISFHSDLPLYSISILAQQSSAKVVSAVSAEETLNINRNIALDAYEPFGNTSKKLFGNAAVINLQGGGTSRVIQSGTYTITFSEPVDVDNLLVQYEPAIGLKMVVTRDGIEVDAATELQKDDKVDIELVPIIPGTDQRISDSDLPKGISWHIDYVVGSNNTVESKNGKILTGVKLLPGDNMVYGTMALPGFAPSVFDVYFYVDDFVYDPGIETEQPDSLVFSRTGNDEDGLPDDLIFRITNEGVVLTKDQLKDLDLKLEVVSVECDNSNVEGFFNRFGNVPSACSLKQNDDGSYTLTPKPVIPFTAFLTKAGDYTVTVGVEGEPTITAVGTFTLVPQPGDWIELIKLAISLLFLLYLIYIIFIKHKFKGQTVYYQAYKLSSDGRGIKLTNDAGTKYLSPWKDLFSLKRASEIKYQGLVLRAGPGGTVIITGKSIAKRVGHYKATSLNPQTQLRSIVSSMQSTKRKNGKKEERFASDQMLTNNRPVYFRTYETDRNIWSLQLM